LTGIFCLLKYDMPSSSFINSKFKEPYLWSKQRYGLEALSL
jgi:hypothetical protein